MFIVRSSHLTAFSRHGRKTFEARLSEALARRWPEQRRTLGAEAFEHYVLRSIDLGLDLGLTLQEDLARFANLCFLLASSPIADQGPPRVMDLLASPHLEGDERLHLAAFGVHALLWRRVESNDGQPALPFLELRALRERAEGPPGFGPRPVGSAMAAPLDGERLRIGGYDLFGQRESCRLEEVRLRVWIEGTLAGAVTLVPKTVAPTSSWHESNDAHPGEENLDIVPSGTCLNLAAPRRPVPAALDGPAALPAPVVLEVLSNGPSCMDRGHPHLLIRRPADPTVVSRQISTGPRPLRFPLWAGPVLPIADPAGSPGTVGADRYHLEWRACREGGGRRAPWERLECTIRVHAEADRPDPRVVSDENPGTLGPISDEQGPSPAPRPSGPLIWLGERPPSPQPLADGLPHPDSRLSDQALAELAGLSGPGGPESEHDQLLVEERRKQAETEARIHPVEAMLDERSRAVAHQRAESEALGRTALEAKVALDEARARETEAEEAVNAGRKGQAALALRMAERELELRGILGRLRRETMQRSQAETAVKAAQAALGLGAPAPSDLDRHRRQIEAARQALAKAMDREQRLLDGKAALERELQEGRDATARKKMELEAPAEALRAATWLRVQAEQRWQAARANQDQSEENLARAVREQEAAAHELDELRTRVGRGRALIALLSETAASLASEHANEASQVQALPLSDEDMTQLTTRRREVLQRLDQARSAAASALQTLLIRRDARHQLLPRLAQALHAHHAGLSVLELDLGDGQARCIPPASELSDLIAAEADARGHEIEAQAHVERAAQDLREARHAWLAVHEATMALLKG